LLEFALPPDELGPRGHPNIIAQALATAGQISIELSDL